MTDYHGNGTLIRLLEAIRETGVKARFYQASSSEMYGKVQDVPQTETTLFYPRSLLLREGLLVLITVNYCESAISTRATGSCSIMNLWRRADVCDTENYLAVAHIKAGLQDKLFLGNLDAKAGTGVMPANMWIVMWLMLLSAG